MKDLPRTLLAGVGYPDLCDHSAGCLLAARWREEEWPDQVTVEDLSYGPIAIVHRLNEARPRFRRLVVAGAVERGRPPGTVTTYRWDRILPGDVEEIQERVAEAATGVISLDNLLIVTRALCDEPPEIALVTEIEPLIEEMGDRLSPSVREGVEQASLEVRSVVSSDLCDEWPAFSLGGPPLLASVRDEESPGPRWSA